MNLSRFGVDSGGGNPPETTPEYIGLSGCCICQGVASGGDTEYAHEIFLQAASTAVSSFAKMPV